jgi:hypothetical protein
MPDFFTEVDAMGIVENHISSVLKLEDDQAQKLLRRYREIRSDLRDRLDRLPGDTFTAQQLRGVMTQVDGAIRAMNSSLQDGMKDAALGTALKGVEDQLTELRAFAEKFQGAVVPINLNAQLVAEDTRNFLFNRYESSLNAYSEDVRNSLVLNLTNESLMESPYSTVIRKLGAFFQGEEWKLHRIARTELHNIYNTGKLNGMTEVRDSTLPDLMKTLIHPMDGRTGADSKYVAELDLIVPLDKPFRYKWKGTWRTYMVPPDRPNDRSILVPYRQEWNQ